MYIDAYHQDENALSFTLTFSSAITPWRKHLSFVILVLLLLVNCLGMPMSIKYQVRPGAH